MSKPNMRKAGDNQGSRGRYSSNLQAILRLLQGESLDALSRELKINAKTLSARQDGVRNANLIALKPRPSSIRAPEGKGAAEPFIRTFKEQLHWIEPFKTI